MRVATCSRVQTCVGGTPMDDGPRTTVGRRGPAPQRQMRVGAGLQAEDGTDEGMDAQMRSSHWHIHKRPVASGHPPSSSCICHVSMVIRLFHYLCYDAPTLCVCQHPQLFPCYRKRITPHHTREIGQLDGYHPAAAVMRTNADGGEYTNRHRPRPSYLRRAQLRAGRHRPSPTNPPPRYPPIPS